MTGKLEPTSSSDMLRQRLAEIDIHLQDLISQRLQITRDIMAAEQVAGRQAPAFDLYQNEEVIRRLIERHQESSPFSTTEHIWRVLMAASDHLETGFSIHLQGTADLADMLDLVRYNYGFSPELIACSDAADVIGAVTASTHDLGVVALDERAELPWWRGLNDTGAQIVARLPFLISETHPVEMPALVISRHQTTGVSLPDTLVYDARWNSVLPGNLMEQGVEVISFYRPTGGVDALLAVSSELSENDVLQACDKAGAEPDVLRIVGGYNAPIDIDSDADDDFGPSCAKETKNDK